MPCFSRVTSEVQFGPKTDLALLTGALTRLGLDLGVVPDDGRFASKFF